MTDKFTNLEPEKRERIVNAALNEFALRGYEKASTNEIVKEAEISKGLLFHYFKSKKQLFLYLYDFGIQIFQHEFIKRIDYEEQEFFTKMRQISKVKLDLHRKYPQLFKFILEAYLETNKEIKDELESRNSMVLMININRLFQNIDTSKFREGIELKEILNIISWTIEGMVNEEIKKCKVLKKELDYDQLFEHADQYLNAFEKLIYKGGHME